jgi:hypothetical protein
MAADVQYFLPMEEEHYGLDRNRQSWANPSPTSAERAPLQRQLFMAVDTMVGNDVNLLQIFIEQVINCPGTDLIQFRKPCVKEKYSPSPSSLFYSRWQRFLRLIKSL